MLSSLWGDLRYAARSLSRTPGFSAAAILTLCLGIGVNVAIFSLFQQILARPLPVAEPERLVNLSDRGERPSSLTFGSMAGSSEAVFSYPMFRDLERAQEAFAGIAAHRIFDASLSTGEQARRDTGLFVSGSYFPVLGLQPAAGRLLGPDDDRVAGEAHAVVLSHAYWRDEFGSDSGIIGRTLTVNGVPLTIVGVAPRGFHGTTVGTRASVFVPITFRGVETPFSIPNHANRGFHWVHLFARLPPGVEPEAAAAAINPLYRAIVAELDAPLLAAEENRGPADFRTSVLALEAGARGQSTTFAPVRERLEMLLAVSGGILLLCCANVAGLLLVRGAARSGEMAVRASIGATRGRLARQLVIESLLLALPAAAASLPVAMLTLIAIASGTPGIPAAAFEADVSLGAALVAITVALVSALAFGLFPLRHLVRTAPGKTLQAHGLRQTSSKAATRFRTVLATTQIALAMALLAVTGIFAQSLASIARIDLGIDVDSVVTFSMSPEASGYAPEASAALFDRLEAELAGIAGVSSAASSMLPLLTGGAMTMNGGQTYLNYVAPEFFETVGIEMLAGRDFGAADVPGAPPVAIVNQRFAERLGVGRDVVGQRTGIQNEIEIVGLVADAKYDNVTTEIGPQIFFARRQRDTLGSATFYVRGTRPPEDLVNAVRETVTRVDPVVPITGLRTMEQQVRENLATERFVAGASSAFAVLATVLAGLGLYGVLAYSVAQRTREIALRVALGAPPGRIRGAVLRQVAAMTLAGAALGVVAAILLGRAAQSLLFGVGAVEPAALVSAAAMLAVVTLLAAYLPARRAVRIDPMIALRYE